MNMTTSVSKRWMALIGLTFAVFVFNMSEFMPIGLLSGIAADLDVTEARAGMLISVYAWVVALLSLPLMMLVSGMEFRKLLFCTVTLFIVSHVLSAMSHSYTALMLSRMGVACAHAVFWSIASPLAVRIAPEGRTSLALSMIVAGTSIAMIAGLPVGRIIGLYMGWRASFLCIAILSAAILAYLAFVFPKVPSDGSFSVKELPTIFKNPVLVGIYILTFVIVTGHYTAYSYIEPFMIQTAGMNDDWTTFTLTAFGIAGILGSMLFSRYYATKQNMFIRMALAGVAVLLLLLHIAAINPYLVLLVCVLWGIGMTSFNVAFQAETIKAAPHATAIAMSLFSGIYNLGIGCGALAGGAVCTYLSLPDIGYVGGAFAVAACVFCFVRLLPLLNGKH